MSSSRQIIDALRRKRLNEATESENFTYKNYLDISKERDSKESYIKFLTQTKGVDPEEAKKQATYNYDEGVEVSLSEAEDDYYEEPYPEEETKYDPVEFSEDVYNAFYDVLSKSDVVFTIDNNVRVINYTLDGIRFQSRLYCTPSNVSVGDPESLEVTPINNKIDKLLDTLYEVGEIVSRKYKELMRSNFAKSESSDYLSEAEDFESEPLDPEELGDTLTSEDRERILSDAITDVIGTTALEFIDTGDETSVNLFDVNSDRLNNIQTKIGFILNDDYSAEYSDYETYTGENYREDSPDPGIVNILTMRIGPTDVYSVLERGSQPSTLRLGQGTYDISRLKVLY